MMSAFVQGLHLKQLYCGYRWLYHLHIPVSAALVHMYFSENCFQSGVKRDSGEGDSQFHDCISDEAVWEFVLNVSLVVCRFKGHFSNTN
jgi:hypothetical protein